MNNHTTLVVCETARNFKAGIDKRLEGSKDVTLKMLFGHACIDGTRYIWVREADMMRGFHGVRVEYWGPFSQRFDLSSFREIQPMVERD